MSRLRPLMLLALAAAALAPVAEAQNPPVRRAPGSWTRVVINGQELTPEMVQDLIFTRRARLGITVATQAQPNDTAGATVHAVTPGGPAFKVGIQSGDIITRLDGTSLTSGPQPEGASAEASIPGLRLVELASKLAPDVTVAIEYKRGDQRRTVSLVTGNEPLAMGGILDGERRLFFDPEVMREFTMERRPGRVSVQAEPLPRAGGVMTFSALGRFTDLELAPINPELGAYFGTTEGVLVIRAGERSNLGLKGGDVLLTIDGRKVNNPGTAMRILRSYEAGDTLRLEVMRSRQRQTLSASISERE